MSDANSAADKLEQPHNDEQAPSDAEEAAAITDETPQTEELAEGANLMELLIEAQQEAKTNLDGWQRAQAEFANYKKRETRVRQRVAQATLKELLPVIDDFDRAFENVPQDISENPWFDGVAMIQRKFEGLLEKFDIETIDPTGEPFDPNFHEAIGADDSDEVESGHVTETLQKGYRAGDFVLRLALVRVAS